MEAKPMPRTTAETIKNCQKPSILLRQRRPVQFALKLKTMPIAPMNVTRNNAIVHRLALLNPAFYGGSGKPNHSESDEKILPEIFHINPPTIWPRSIKRQSQKTYPKTKTLERQP